MSEHRSSFSFSRRVHRCVNTLFRADHETNDESEMLIEDDKSSIGDEKEVSVVAEMPEEKDYNNPVKGEAGPSAEPDDYFQIFEGNGMDPAWSHVPFYRTYHSAGLHVKLEPDDQGKLVFDLKNRKNVSGRGWEAFLALRDCVLNLEKLAIDHVPDVNDLLIQLHPIFARHFVRKISAVEIFHSKNLDYRLVNSFFEKYKVTELNAIPLKPQYFEQPCMKKLEILYGVGEAIPFNDGFLKETRFAAIEIDVQDPQVTASGIKSILCRWLKKEIIICQYQFHIRPCNPRELWPDVPVRQMRYQSFHKGSRNYILKKFFGGDDVVRLIRTDDKELKVSLRGTQLSLREKGKD